MCRTSHRLGRTVGADTGVGCADGVPGARSGGGGRPGRPTRHGRPSPAVAAAHLLVRANQLVTTDALIDLLSGRRAAGGCPQRAPGIDLTSPPGVRGTARTPRVGLRGARRTGRTGSSRGSRSSYATGGRSWMRNPQDAADTLREALDIWRGPAFADSRGRTVAPGRDRPITELQSLAEEERISSDLALGHHHEVIGELESFTNADPLRERLWGMLMLALYRSGRQADALAAYARARDLLSEQLGIDPSRGLQRLHARSSPRIRGCRSRPGTRPQRVAGRRPAICRPGRASAATRSSTCSAAEA